MAPALHALIIGVSHYPHLPQGAGATAAEHYGMGQLSASAGSAAAIRDWLHRSRDRLPVPIGSVRTLLSPSAAEDGLLDGGPRAATLDEVRRAALAWREDCARHKDGIALFFFAGHGVQRTRTDAVLLLEDFLATAGDPLFHGIDVNNLVNGMAPTVDRPEMARTQLWFLDTCRAYPSAFDRFEALQASRAFEVGLSDLDDRCAPVFFGSIPGGAALAKPGHSTIFSRALRECLDGAAGVRRNGTPFWDVTVGSLTQALEPVIDRVNAEVGGDQIAFVGGQITAPRRRIVTVPGTPHVPVSLELRPDASADGVQLRVTCPDGSAQAVPAPLAPNPFRDRWPAGVYQLGAAPPGCGIAADALVVLPPEFEWVGEVT